MDLLSLELSLISFVDVFTQAEPESKLIKKFVASFLQTAKEDTLSNTSFFTSSSSQLSPLPPQPDVTTPEQEDDTNVSKKSHLQVRVLVVWQAGAALQEDARAGSSPGMHLRTLGPYPPVGNLQRLSLHQDASSRPPP